jgi:hypothetical protein
LKKELMARIVFSKLILVRYLEFLNDVLKVHKNDN